MAASDSDDRNHNHLTQNQQSNAIKPFFPNAPFLYLLKTSENPGVRERVHWEQMD